MLTNFSMLIVAYKCKTYNLNSTTNKPRCSPHAKAKQLCLESVLLFFLSLCVYHFILFIFAVSLHSRDCHLNLSFVLIFFWFESCVFSFCTTFYAHKMSILITDCYVSFEIVWVFLGISTAKTHACKRWHWKYVARIQWKYFVSFRFDCCLNSKTANKKIITHTHNRSEPLVTIAKHALNSPHHIASHIPFCVWIVCLVCKIRVCLRVNVCTFDGASQAKMLVLVHCCGCCYCRRHRHRVKAITSCLTHTLRSYFACRRMHRPLVGDLILVSGNICPYMDASEWCAGERTAVDVVPSMSSSACTNVLCFAPSRIPNATVSRE